MRSSALLLALLAVPATAADWASLETRPAILTRIEFDERVSKIYAPQGGLDAYLERDAAAVTVYADAARTGAPVFRLTFAGAEPQPPAFPLKPRICLDPGHIGGSWARMEERLFLADRNDWYVQEAALNLFVARLVKDRLEAQGLDVVLTKNDFDPVTDRRPADFEAETAAALGDYSYHLGLPDLFRVAARLDSIRKRSELAFFRGAEIEARAQRVNETLRPDLTICIHFNARETENPRELVDEEGLAVFIHGNYLPSELADPEQRFHLFRKLLEGSHALEMRTAREITRALADATGLPPAYRARSGPLYPVDGEGYLYARNLAANRLFNGPVVFLEPYFMNGRVTYRRIQAGDYDGEREIEGVPRRSLFREYADAVAAGVSNALAQRP